MKIVHPGNTLHELLYFVGYSRLLPEGPHTIYVPKESLAGRDELPRFNCPHLFPWVLGFVRGLPDDLAFDLDLRPALMAPAPYSYPALYGLHCGEFPPQLFRPFLDREPAETRYAVLSRERGLKNDLFPWKETCQHLHAQGVALIFWGDEEQFSLLREEVGAGVPISFEPRLGLQELYEVLSQAEMFVGTQGEALFFSEALGLPQVVEVSPRNPDSVILREGSWTALADRVVMPDGTVILGSKPPLTSLFNSAHLPVPDAGWCYPGLPRRRQHFDLDLFVKIVKKRLQLTLTEKELRAEVLAHTARVDFQWALSTFYGRFFRRAEEALLRAGNKLPLTEYLPPPTIGEHASCPLLHQRNTPPL